MSRCPQLFGLIFVFLAGPTAPLATAAVFGGVQIDVRIDSREIQVTTQYDLSSQSLEESIDFLSQAATDTPVRDVQVDCRGEAWEHQLLEGDHSVQLVVEPAAQLCSAFRLTYVLDSPQNPRIPIFVPKSATSAPFESVGISVQLAGDLTLAGSLFPRLDPAGKNAYSANLGSIPGLLFVPVKAAALLSWRDRFLGVEELTNLGLLAVVLSLVGWRWRQWGRKKPD